MDELLIVLLCEIGERIVAMREALAEPSLASKPHAHAVATMLGDALQGIEDRLQHEIVAAGCGADGTGLDLPAHLAVLSDCAAALRALHRRLGLLDLRWNAAPADIFLRKLRDDVGSLPHPAVALSDDYAVLDDDVAERLRADLAAAHVAPPGPAPATVVAFPRLEAADPLTWPLLLPALARVYLQQAQHPQTGTTPGGGPASAAAGRAEDRDTQTMVALRLGGPAVFAALAAHALWTTTDDTPVGTPLFWSLAETARLYAGGLGDTISDRGDFKGGLVDVFVRLARERDELLGHTCSSEQSLESGDYGLPAPAVPTAEEAQGLLAKLANGIPINAIAPTAPPDFVDCLDAVDGPDAFYALIRPLGERPASLAAILGVGWLYKIRHSYPLFGELLHARGRLRPALDAYRAHVLERNALLVQSIEAAYVQDIFKRGTSEA